MLQTFQTVGITVLAYGAALIFAGCVVWGIVWLLRDERPGWLKAITVLCLIGFFVVYPVILLLFNWFTVNPNPPNDRPYQENKYDRYN